MAGRDHLEPVKFNQGAGIDVEGRLDGVICVVDGDHTRLRAGVRVASFLKGGDHPAFRRQHCGGAPRSADGDAECGPARLRRPRGRRLAHPGDRGRREGESDAGRDLQDGARWLAIGDVRNDVIVIVALRAEKRDGVRCGVSRAASRVKSALGRSLGFADGA